MATISCPKCHASLDESKKFCTECGTKLEKEQSSAEKVLFSEEKVDEIAAQDTQKFSSWTESELSMEEAVKAVFQEDDEEEKKDGMRKHFRKKAKKDRLEDETEEEVLDADQQTIVDFSALAGSTLDDSPYEPVTAWGFIGILALFSVPVIGWIFAIVWACGGCRKVNKRNLARGYLMILGLIAVFCACAMFAVMKIAPALIETNVSDSAVVQEEKVYTVQGTKSSDESSQDLEEGTDSLITRLREIGSDIWDAYHDRELEGGAELTAILDGDRDALISMGYTVKSVDQVLNMVNGDFEALSSLLNLIEGQAAEEN